MFFAKMFLASGTQRSRPDQNWRSRLVAGNRWGSHLAEKGPVSQMCVSGPRARKLEAGILPGGPEAPQQTSL